MLVVTIIMGICSRNSNPVSLPPLQILGHRGGRWEGVGALELTWVQPPPLRGSGKKRLSWRRSEGGKGKNHKHLTISGCEEKQRKEDKLEGLLGRRRGRGPGGGGEGRRLLEKVTTEPS